ncbi:MULTISPECIES: glycosyltransferase family 4 protein [Haloferax]|nr:glycosyltransferase family 4 protein [Haloferax mediterranei]MDX5987412.1 glycosyltransferase family 4 protein [Haloferax mediterranei ATCC 33500]
MTKNNKTITWLTPHSSQTGGNWVTKKVQSELSENYSITTKTFEHGSSLIGHGLSAAQFATHNNDSVDLWVENPFTFSFKRPGIRTDDIVACHHIHYPHPSNAWYQPSEVGRRIKNELFLKRAAHASRVVVVSDYWKQFLNNHGITNVSKVHNGLPIENFDFDQEKVDKLKKELSPDDKPIIHLGIPAKLKGTKKAYHELKGMDAKFITTGRKDYHLPVEHLNPDYEGYLRILAAADVVVSMSQFDEGWGLFVHEALLAGTPVVGTGRGGMSELLNGGDQIVCEEFSDLKSSVRKALDMKESLGKSGHQFVKQFSVERMVSGWDQIFKEIP